MLAFVPYALPAARVSPGGPDMLAVGLMVAGGVLIVAAAVAGGVLERRLRARFTRRPALPPEPGRVVLPPHPDDIPGGLPYGERLMFDVIAARIVLQLDDLEEG